MTDTDCNEANLDAMWALAGWVIAGGEAPEKWTGGVAYQVGFQRRIVAGGEVSGLAGAVADLRET